MADVKTIRNTTGIPQSVVFQGRQVTLAAYAKQDFDVLLAEAFLARCAPMVEAVAQELPDVLDPAEGDTTIWIANVTGHPAYKPEIRTKVLQNKKWVETTAPNPAASLYPVHQLYRPGDKEYTDRGGKYATRTLAPVPITIKPHERKPFTKDIGEWFMRHENDCNRMSGWSPACIKSRKPTAYEPDLSWSLDEIRAYLQLVSAGMNKVAVPSEADIAQASREKAYSRPQIYQMLQDAKQAGINACWYYVVDPAFRLPTKSEVRELMTGKSAVEIVDEQLDRIVDQATAP